MIGCRADFGKNFLIGCFRDLLFSDWLFSEFGFYAFLNNFLCILGFGIIILAGI